MSADRRLTQAEAAEFLGTAMSVHHRITSLVDAGFHHALMEASLSMSASCSYEQACVYVGFALRRCDGDVEAEIVPAIRAGVDGMRKLRNSSKET